MKTIVVAFPFGGHLRRRFFFFCLQETYSELGLLSRGAAKTMSLAQGTRARGLPKVDVSFDFPLPLPVSTCHARAPSSPSRAR